MAKHWRAVTVVMLLVLLAWGLMPSTASGAATLVQQNTGNGGGATTLNSLTVTLASATKVGNLLIMVGANWCTSLNTPTGGGVTTWLRAAFSTSNTNVEIWYGTVDTSSATGVTATVTGCTGGMWMNLTEWSGLWGVVDQAAALAGTTSPASAGSITTTNASDLVIFGVADPSGNTYGSPSLGGTPGPWTAMTAITSPAAQSSWYQNVSATGTFNPTVSETKHAWDAAMATFKACSVTDASYVVGDGQKGQATVYWPSGIQVIIVRNTTGTFTAPTNGTQYAVNNTIGSGNTVVYVGSAGGFTDASLTNGILYYYKAFTNCALSYSTGVVINLKPTDGTATPPTAPLWSYATTATTLAAPGIDDNDVVVWGGNDYKIHGANAADGTLAIAPYTTTVTTGAIQSRPMVIPAAYSTIGVNVAYVTSQDGNVYAINTDTGALIWKSNIAGPPVLQGGAAVFLKAFGPSVSICGASTDVVFVGTRNTANHTGNVVYALNGSTNTVATTAGGNCPGGNIGPGGIMWQFTGGSPNPSMDYISSTPYIDYRPNPPVLWVTSRAQAGTSQPSLWKFNLTNGTLANTTCGSATPSVWCLGDIDNTLSQSADGTWIYVTTAMATPTFKTVNGATVYSYTPSGTGVLGAPVSLGAGSLGTPTTIAYVNSAKNTATSSNTCQVTLPSVTAGNTIVVVATMSTTAVSVGSITDTSGSFYTKHYYIGVTGAELEIWAATAAGTGGTITVTLAAGATASQVCIASQYSGVGVVGAHTAATGSSKTASVSLTTATGDTNNWIVAGFAAASSTTPTSSVGTLRQATALSAPLSGALSDNVGSGSVTNTVTIATTSTNWAATAIELRTVTVDTIVFTQAGGNSKLVQFNGAATNQFYAPYACICGATGTPVYDGVGFLYTGSTNGNINRFDAATFGIYRTNIAIAGSTVTIGDPSFDGVLKKIYVGASDGHVYAINPF
jgi:hypothetical protein